MTDADWIKFLLGVISTVVFSTLSYLAGAKGKMTAAACAKCQDACKREMLAIMEGIRTKQAELSIRQDELDHDIGKKLDLLFRMLRATIMRLPIDEDKKAEIINDRGSV
jgi:hypothetical protein